MPPSLFFSLSLLTVALAPWAAAIHQDSGVDSSECQWASVVHFGSTCTGFYLGDGVVVSAAHCDMPGSVRFSERGKGSFDDGSFKVNVQEEGNGKKCVRHPDYSGNGYKGPDIMYCILDSQDENYHRLDEIPIIYPMMPTGCERDWLSNQVYNVYKCPEGASKWSCENGPEVVGVGVGCANAAVAGSTGCSMDDVKRHSLPKFRLVRQESHNYDPTSLYVHDTEYGAGVMSGDSGGPLFVELPDHTWRVIGVLHSSGIGANYAALPNRLRWIEHTSGRDITPCHTWLSGSYQWSGSCGGVHPLDPELPPNAAKWDATDGCKTDMPFANMALGECGNWWSGVGGLEGYAPGGGGGGVTTDVDSLTSYDSTHDGDGDLFNESYFVSLHQRLTCEASLDIAGTNLTYETRGSNRRGLLRGALPGSMDLSTKERRGVCDLLGNSAEQSIPCVDGSQLCI